VESCPKKCLVMENEYSQPLIQRKKEVFKSA
jgi:formate hydrogenlyase subunit 6/NADH:ubiquinone oxidoreductase subunit I